MFQKNGIYKKGVYEPNMVNHQTKKGLHSPSLHKQIFWMKTISE